MCDSLLCRTLKLLCYNTRGCNPESPHVTLTFCDLTSSIMWLWFQIEKWLAGGLTALPPTLIDKSGCLMTLSFGKVQTVTALTDPSTLWTPDELQVYQQLFRMTLPQKNQSAQTCWGCGAVEKGKYMCVCVWCSLCAQCCVWPSTTIFPQCFLLLTIVHLSHRVSLKSAFFDRLKFNKLD